MWKPSQPACSTSVLGLPLLERRPPAMTPCGELHATRRLAEGDGRMQHILAGPLPVRLVGGGPGRRLLRQKRAPTRRLRA